MSETKIKKIDTRIRNYGTIVYPESAPSNWLDIIRDLKVPCLISPLHDKDINPDGTPKKAHYHVEFCFDGKKSVEQFDEIRDKIKGVGVEQVISQRGYARYLCHLDNPEKFQYKPEDVTCIGGIDYLSVIGLPTDKYKAISEMKDFINENHIIAFCDLFDYACDNRYDWFRCLCDNSTVIIKEYLKSRSWKAEQKHRALKDSRVEYLKVTEEGEVIEND